MSGGVGTFIMAEVRTGLVLMGTDAYVQDAFVGLAIALAAIINVRLSARRRWSESRRSLFLVLADQQGIDFLRGLRGHQGRSEQVVLQL